MSRREYQNTQDAPTPTGRQPLFYAPLTGGTLNATIAHDSNLSVHNSVVGSLLSDSVRLSSSANGIIWNCSVPVNTNITFNCWVKRTGGSGVNYSFGAATKNNARYYGLQLSQYNAYWLMQEYLYFCYVSANYMPENNVWTYISWTIIYNGSNNYTCKFYKNGQLVTEKTFNNTQWLGMTNCYFGISHFTNSMYAYYKHFSAYEELTDGEVAQLYQNGGVPL